MTRYYASNFYGSLYFNSWYYGGGATPPPPTPTTGTLISTDGASGGYFTPDEYWPRDSKRRWETDDEIMVILGGPLL